MKGESPAIMLRQNSAYGDAGQLQEELVEERVPAR